MQQAIYNSSTNTNGNSVTIPAAKTNKAAATARRAGLARRLARRWDLVGVVALMGSSAAYGAFALAHVGF